MCRVFRRHSIIFISDKKTEVRKNVRRSGEITSRQLNWNYM